MSAPLQFLSSKVIWIAFGLIVAVAGGLWFATMSVTRDVAASEDSTELAQADDDEGEENSEDVAPASTVPLEVTYDVFLPRDPFESIRPPEPVETTPTGTTDPTDPTAPTPPGTTPTPTSPGVPGSGESPDDKDPADLCRSNGEVVCNGTVVVVTGVQDGAAWIDVDGVNFVVTPGQSFAERFQLIAVRGDDCAEILYRVGDEASLFTQCVGDAAAVK